MAKLLTGKEVANSIDSNIIERSSALKAKGINPTLCIIRIGSNPSDMIYEKHACRKAESLGIYIKKIDMSYDTSKKELMSKINSVNSNNDIHGLLILRPLPEHLKEYENEIFNKLNYKKDVDCITSICNAGVFQNTNIGYAPCTPEACMEILNFYGIDCEGKSVAVIGRSLVVGRPLSIMLMNKNATVTICHTKTKNIKEICKSSDIIVTSAGCLNSITKDHVKPGQIIIDVAMNWDPNKPNSKGSIGAFSGDSKFDEVEPIVDAITPVPGGVGAVTTSILMRHVVEAAEKLTN